MRTKLALGLGSVALLAAAPQAQDKTTKPKAVRAARIVAAPTGNQAPSQEELIKRRDQKMSEAWIQNAAWIPDFDKARETAREENKKILAYFTRSYSP